MLYVKWFRKEHHKYKERRYLQQTHQWSIQMWFFWIFATLIICFSLAAATFSTLCVDSASLKDYCVDRSTDCWHEALLLRTAVESCSRRHPLGARTFNILQIHVSRHIGMCAHRPSVATYRGKAAGVDTFWHTTKLTQFSSACGKERSRKVRSIKPYFVRVLGSSI